MELSIIRKHEDSQLIAYELFAGVCLKFAVYLTYPKESGSALTAIMNTIADNTARLHEFRWSKP